MPEIYIMGQMTEIMFEMTELEQWIKKQNMTLNRDIYVSAFRYKEPTKTVKYTERRAHCLNSILYEKI